MSRRSHPSVLVAGVVALGASFLSVLAPAAVTAPAAASTPADDQYGLAAMTAFDQLPYLNLQERSGHLSSVAPARTNQDWDNYLYTDSDGGRVILDNQGPGVITRLHLTLAAGASAATTHVKVYLDGAATPQIDDTMASLAAGTNAPFLAPLVDDQTVGSGGYTYYLPIPYAKSARVALSGPGSIYWQTDWRSFPPGTPIQTWTGNEDSSQVRQLWSHAGQNPNTQPDDVDLSGTTSLPAPGDATVLTDLAGPQEITAIKLKIPGVGPTRGSSIDVLDDTHIRIYWDNEPRPSVDAPLGSFFGMGYLGAAPTRATAMGMLADGTMYMYFPMPFQHHAKIELVNDTLGSNVTTVPGVSYTITHRPFTGGFGNVGYFRAQWTPQTVRPQSQADQAAPDSVHWLDVSGAGKVVGIVESRASHQTPGTSAHPLGYLEGNVHMFVDGSRTPSWRDNGTEDTFDGGYYFNNGPVENPNAGDNIKTSNAIAAYRVFIGDAIPFRSHISIDDEPGGAFYPYYTTDFPLVFYYSQTPRMARSDGFDVGDAAAAAAHNYQITGQTEDASLTSTFDSYLHPAQVTGQVHAQQGSSQFTLTVDPANQGVVLRRSYDQGTGRQAADVYVDGTLVGRWYQSYANNVSRWADDDFTIPPADTAGKDAISVQLRWVPGSPAWTESTYTAYSIEPPPSDGGQSHVTQPPGTVFAGLDTPSTLINGYPQIVTGTLINTTNVPLPAVQYHLSTPEGWQVTPVGAQPTLIAAHQEAHVRWRVTVPPGTPAGNSPLGLSVDYSTDSGTATVASAPQVTPTTPPITVSAFSVDPNTTQPGQDATFHVTVRNVSPDPQRGNVSISGPDNWTIGPANNAYNLDSGASQVFTATTTNPGSWTALPLTFTANTTYGDGKVGGQGSTELFAGNVRCLLGKSDQPIWHADAGYGCTLDQGFQYYDPNHQAWLPSAPANYCWCQGGTSPLLFHVNVPAGVSGTLGLLLVDGDNNAGGRVESISVEGRNLGTFSNFQQGKWVTADVTAAATADGKIAVRVDNARQGSNVVVSQATFATTTPPPPVAVSSFSVTPNTAQPGQQATFHVTVRNVASSSETGQLSITGPDGWAITPATQSYTLAGGASQTFTATTTNLGTSTSMPLTFTANTTYGDGNAGGPASTELYAGHLRCLLGNTDEPIWHADPGFGCTLDQGYQFYDPNHSSWPLTTPANYCWCEGGGQPLLFHLTVPAGTSGTLRLLLVDGDNYQGGRVESVSVEGRNLGTFSNFQQGTWVSADISSADTADGRINVEIDDARQGSNVVLSQATF